MPNLLIVEDQPALREILRTVFEDICDIRTAANGIEALAILLDWQPEVVITDYAMPGMTGLELIRKIHAISDARATGRSPLREHIKIILMSACLTDEIKREAAELGVAACVDKPFDLAMLRGLVMENKQK